MRIFRFDPEVARPVTRFGSRFRLGSLIVEGSAVTVNVVHLGPAGRVGRHPAAGQQLFAVVSGAGWATGGDDRRRALRPGHAVLWDAGEEHAAGTDDGMTAVSLEGTFRVGAYAVTTEIVVEDYNPEWPAWFEQVRAEVWPAVAERALLIDHVGSTSVPHLAAKPIIDMDIVVASEADILPVVDALAGIGYRWEGDLGVPGRDAFRRQAEDGLPRHHLYLVVQDNRAHQDHWLLRDLLRSDPTARERYAQLKRDNAAAAEGDIDYYVAAKAALVAELLTRARAERALPAVPYWDPEITSS